MFAAVWMVCLGLQCSQVEELKPKFFANQGECIEYAKSKVAEIERDFSELFKKTVFAIPDCRSVFAA
jgi:hypothetical protein